MYSNEVRLKGETHMNADDFNEIADCVLRSVEINSEAAAEINIKHIILHNDDCKKLIKSFEDIVVKGMSNRTPKGICR